MLKYILLVALVLVAVQARPQQKGRDADTVIEKFVNENTGNGPYNLEVKLSDGQETNAKGELQQNPEPNSPPFVAVRGSFSWFDPEGNLQLTKYIADEYGYKVL